MPSALDEGSHTPIAALLPYLPPVSGNTRPSRFAVSGFVDRGFGNNAERLLSLGLHGRPDDRGNSLRLRRKPRVPNSRELCFPVPLEKTFYVLGADPPHDSLGRVLHGAGRGLRRSRRPDLRGRIDQHVQDTRAPPPPRAGPPDHHSLARAPPRLLAPSRPRPADDSDGA